MEISKTIDEELSVDIGALVAFAIKGKGKPCNDIEDDHAIQIGN